ncbi:MAG: hypothetical protein G8237_05680 [Magnetococcales bacterium]|nr:hypothetical protein [Magnetococcales bacterium]
MNSWIIDESGMHFGPYPKDRCFRIEKSRCYKAIQDGVRMAEFLLLRESEKSGSPVMWIIEARSSSPRPENRSDFNKFIIEIREKFVNAFALGWASCLGRHPYAVGELPEAFKTLDLMQTDVRFALVIRGHQEAWLSPLQDALKMALRVEIKTWRFSSHPVIVMNEDLARRHGLIISYVET